MQLNYVLCPSYHGATLLAVLLANHSRIASLGDAIPSREFVQRCSCGEKVDRCAFWTGLLNALHPLGADASGSFAEKLEQAFPVYRATRTDQALALAGLALGNWAWALRKRRIAFAGRYMRFWGEVLRAQDADLFVDGEKSVTKVAMFKSLFGRMADVRALHLTRDPRGFLNSCRKHMDGVTLEQAAAMWNHNATIARLQRPFFKCRYKLLRYEDLCGNPQQVMDEVFRFLGVASQDVVRRPSNPAKYHMMGNKMLMRFDGAVRLDQGWKEGVSASDQERILELTAPLSADLDYC